MFLILVLFIPPAFAGMDQDGTLYLNDANADRLIGLQDIIYQLQLITGVRSIKYASGPDVNDAQIVLINDTGTIQGVVSEDTGDAEIWIPISGALVICTSENGEKFTQKTGKNGGFRFESVRPGQHIIAVSHDRYISSRIKADVEAEMVATINVRLKKMENIDGNVSGHVLTPDPSGTLSVLPDAIVSLFAVNTADLNKEIAAGETPIRKTITDETGAYYLDAIPQGRYFVMANKRGFQKVLSIVSVVGGSESKRNLVLFPEPSEETGTLMGKVVEKAPNVSSGVWDTFYPVDNASVSIGFIKDGTIEVVRSGKTNKNGGFSFIGVPVGEYSLFVRHDEFEDYRQQIVIKPETYSPLPVINPNGSIIVSEGVSESSNDNNVIASDSAQSAYELLKLIQNVGTGCFCVDPYSNWHQATQFVKVILTRKQQQQKAMLSGHVFALDNLDAATAQRIPVSGATLIARPYFPYPTLTATDETDASFTFAPLPEFKTQTSDDGFYEFPDLSVGYPVDGKLVYVITVVAQGFATVTEKVAVIPGEMVQHDIILKPSGVIATFGGIVYDGSVKCDDGTKCLVPIENADVILFPLLSTDENKLSSDIGEHVVTGPDGKFFFPRLAAIEYQIVVRAPNFVPFKNTIHLAPGENDSMEIFLQPVEQNIRIQGVVMTHSDQCSDGVCEKPVPGAIVYLYPEITTDLNTVISHEKAVTDENGVFQFFNISEGTYNLLIKAQGFEKLEDTVDVPPEEPLHLSFMLNPVAERGDLKGHVFNGAANCVGANCILNIPGAEISLFSLFGTDPDIAAVPLFQTKSDERGYYFFEQIPSGKYQMIVRAEMFRPWEGFVEILSGEIQVQDITLLPENSITGLKGHVFDASTDCASEDCLRPISNASVLLVSMKNSSFIPILRTETDSNGIYSFKDIPAGEYQMTVRANQYEPFEMVIRLEAGDVQEKDISLKPFIGESILKGMVHDGSVRCTTDDERCIVPIAGAYIQLFFLTPDSSGTIPNLETTSDKNGLYELSGMPSGEYAMQVRAEGFMEWKKQVMIESATETEINVNLMPQKPLAHLKGRILDGMVDCDNMADCILPIPKAKIELISELDISSMEPLFTESNEMGEYEFFDIPSAPYSIHIKAENYQDRVDHIEIQEGENIRNFELMPARYCEDSSNCSSNEFCSKPVQECEGTGICLPRPEGCPEIYKPVCGCDGNTYGNECEAAANGINVLYFGECKPEPETGALKGMVWDAKTENMPIAGADIYLVQILPPGVTNSDANQILYEFKTQSNDDGSYALPKLPVGLYTIIARAVGYQAWKGEIEIIQDTTLEKDILLIPYSAIASLKGIVSGNVPECDSAGTCLKPVANALVVLTLLNLTDTSSDTTVTKQLETKTDDQGHYAFNEIKAGEYSLHIEADGWMIWEEPIKILPGKETLIDIELQVQPEPSVLKGIVRNGAVDCDITASDCIVGIPGVIVTLIPRNNDMTLESMTTETDNAGKFIFESIPTGWYVITFETENFEPQKMEIEIYPGENPLEIELYPIARCTTNSDCDDQFICKKTMGDCEGQGICQPRPEACIMLLDPVCGCNGKTYGNECIAESAGENVAFDGECPIVEVP